MYLTHLVGVWTQVGACFSHNAGIFNFHFPRTDAARFCTEILFSLSCPWILACLKWHGSRHRKWLPITKESNHFGWISRKSNTPTWRMKEDKMKKLCNLFTLLYLMWHNTHVMRWGKRDIYNCEGNANIKYAWFLFVHLGLYIYDKIESACRKAKWDPNY